MAIEFGTVVQTQLGQDYQRFVHKFCALCFRRQNTEDDFVQIQICLTQNVDSPAKSDTIFRDLKREFAAKMVNGVESRLLVPSKNAFQYLNQSLGMLTVQMGENLDRSVDTTAMAALISRVLEKTFVALMESGQFLKEQ